MIAYFDCFSGVSGDMTLGALLDAGLSLDTLRSELGKLNLSGYSLSSERIVSRGISGTRVVVHLGEQGQRHDHDEHHGRHLREVLQLICESNLSEWVKRNSSDIFQRLARAEGAVHGIPPSQVHFHEVGAVDAIVDVVGACIGLEALGVRRVFSSPLPTGSGTVQCAHGLLPAPAPGTLELLREARAPTWPGPGPGELVTPTGAAIVCALATFSQPRLRIERTGYGFGRKELPWVNALRLWLGTPLDECLEEDTVALLETNIDDEPGELLGAAMERLFEAGALDVYFTPIQMKKNRPAIQLSVISPRERAFELAEVTLRETTSLGLRVSEVRRWKAVRRQERLQTPWGEVTVKVKVLGESSQVYPEYEDCRRLAREKGISLMEIYEYVRRSGRQREGSPGFPQKSGA